MPWRKPRYTFEHYSPHTLSTVSSSRPAHFLPPFSHTHTQLVCDERTAPLSRLVLLLSSPARNAASASADNVVLMMTVMAMLTLLSLPPSKGSQAASSLLLYPCSLSLHSSRSEAPAKTLGGAFPLSLSPGSLYHSAPGRRATLLLVQSPPPATALGRKGEKRLIHQDDGEVNFLLNASPRLDRVDRFRWVNTQTHRRV